MANNSGREFDHGLMDSAETRQQYIYPADPEVHRDYIASMSNIFQTIFASLVGFHKK
jgi:hypothetical protein